MASKSVKALKNLSKYEIDCCICNYVVVTYLKMGYFGCTVDFSSDGINYSASLLVAMQVKLHACDFQMKRPICVLGTHCMPW